MDKDKVAGGIMLAADALAFLYIVKSSKKTTASPPPTSTPPPQSPPPTSTPPPQSPPPSTTEYGSVDFVEDGFYQVGQLGYTWSVTINGETKSGVAVVSFTLPYGTYQYTVTVPNGMSASPSSGTVTINSPGPAQITINFSGVPEGPPAISTEGCHPLSYSEFTVQYQGVSMWGLGPAMEAVFRAFNDTIENAPQQSYNGPTAAYDPKAYGGVGAMVWFADGKEFIPPADYPCDIGFFLNKDNAFGQYAKDHFSEAQLLGLYWTDCYWFLYVLYPGVSYTVVNPDLHPAEISSADQIAPGLTFIGPSSLLSAFGGGYQGNAVALKGCSFSTVADHTVTFVESGLPPGTTWRGPSVEMGSWVTQENTDSTEFQIIIPYAEEFTAHDVYVPTRSGVVTYHPNPASGTANPGETIQITYSPERPTTQIEFTAG